MLFSFLCVSLHTGRKEQNITTKGEMMRSNSRVLPLKCIETNIPGKFTIWTFFNQKKKNNKSLTLELFYKKIFLASTFSAHILGHRLGLHRVDQEVSDQHLSWTTQCLVPRPLNKTLSSNSNCLSCNSLPAGKPPLVGFLNIPYQTL